MNDELPIRQLDALGHGIAGQQAQLRNTCLVQYVAEPALRPLHDARRHVVAIAYRPHNLGHRKAAQQRVQQIHARLVERATLQDAGDDCRILEPRLAFIDRHHLDLLTDQRMLALLHAGEHLTVPLQVAVDLAIRVTLLQQQRVVRLQNAEIGVLVRVTEPVCDFRFQLRRRRLLIRLSHS